MGAIRRDSQTDGQGRGWGVGAAKDTSKVEERRSAKGLACTIRGNSNVVVEYSMGGDEQRGSST